MVKIQTGCACIDNALGGGIPPESVTLIYGEPETGKSTLAMQCAVDCAAKELKVLYVDTENTFSAKRLSQLAGERFDAIAERIMLVKPKDFREQTVLVDTIQDYIGKGFGLLVIDTFTALYAAKVSETSGKAAFGINRELNRQLAILAQVTKVTKTPIVITSQVRTVPAEENPIVRPVATRVLKFWADNIIALKPTEFPLTLKAVVEKAHEKEVEETCYVQIGEAGILDAEFH
jgi:RecA/RadA recombinase